MKQCKKKIATITASETMSSHLLGIGTWQLILFQVYRNMAGLCCTVKQGVL